ncbi:MAG: 30S ribosomal protein S12 methylthiotransferase RimO [Acidobacteria bacterium]|jgi:ribosomal protein S12 methylthiotransferase|nr:30S ribosomal protein S12 methylthiotransferase RimO [Acidobacteriota bacterium]
MTLKGSSNPAPSRNPRVRVGMISLGCAKNLVDGETMLGHLARDGIELTSDATRADVVIVNTCGFIDDAKRESIDSILEVADAKGGGSVRQLIVTGCMAQAYARELKEEIPEIDAFVGLDELERITEAVRGELGSHVPDQRGAVRVYDHRNTRIVSTGSYAYLKVAEGCDNPCSFCHIPAMRGSFRSRPIPDLLAEARALESQGVRELVLIAQDTTRYGEDLGLRNGLRSLIESLLTATSLPWIRFLYAYPATLDEGLFDLMAREERFIPYLDIPLQHASRTVLKKMKRGGDARTYRALIDRARSRVPDLTLRSTFIVGFPGEGDGEFAELLDFVREVRFDHLGAFTYSWQAENPGADLGDPVTAEEKERRHDLLLETQQEIALEINNDLVGRHLPALVSGALPEMELLLEARLQRQAPEIDGRLLINDGTAAPGSLVEVEVTEAHPYDIVGRIARVLMPGEAPAVRLPVMG